MRKGLVNPSVYAGLYLASVFCVLTVLSFSVSTLFDKALVILTSISFCLCVRADWKAGRESLLKTWKRNFWGNRLLLLALGAYYLWNLVTLFYTRDFSLALRGLPYRLEYLFLFLAGLYYCNSRKRLILLLGVIGLAGSVVSAASYLLYFFSRRPIYFQRTSTARDYNVYATLIFFSLVIAVTLILNFFQGSFWQRCLLLAGVLALNLPAFYLAGSRRMVILLPYFAGFALLYEGIRLALRKDWRRLAEQAVLLLCCGAAYFGVSLLAEPFAQFGAEKERAYQEWVSLQQSGQQSPGGNQAESTVPEKTISSILETIENGSMSSKRKLIYSTALRELLGYSPTEWVWGRGQAYDLVLFDRTDDQALLEAYGYTTENRPSKGWMSAHNFLLADVLGGGIIQLLLGLLVCFSALAQTAAVCRKIPPIGLAVCIPAALCLCNSFISGAFGLLNNVFFLVVLTILCGGSVLFKSSGDAGEPHP